MTQLFHIDVIGRIVVQVEIDFNDLLVYLLGLLIQLFDKDVTR